MCGGWRTGSGMRACCGWRPLSPGWKRRLRNQAMSQIGTAARIFMVSHVERLKRNLTQRTQSTQRKSMNPSCTPAPSGGRVLCEAPSRSIPGARRRGRSVAELVVFRALSLKLLFETPAYCTNYRRQRFSNLDSRISKSENRKLTVPASAWSNPGRSATRG
jgi:hypothetical protein